MNDDEHQKLQDAVDTLRNVELAVESPVSCLESAVGDPDAKQAVESRASEENWIRADDE